MAETAQILLVEDERSLAEALSINLDISGYQVHHAANGNDALRLFSQLASRLSLVLLDVMLPDVNGFDLCSQFKKLKPDLPVIFLTAKSLTADKIGGLKLGADDYITKPFDLEELLLRISNLLKRFKKDNSTRFKFSGGEIDFLTFEIKDHLGQTHTLSKREIGLLELLSRNNNKVISRDEILEKLWDVNENASSRTIDNYILNFRKYFELNPKEPRHFHSIRGVGYKFTA